jgi:integrase/recombinase XerD
LSHYSKRQHYGSGCDSGVRRGLQNRVRGTCCPWWVRFPPVPAISSVIARVLSSFVILDKKCPFTGRPSEWDSIDRVSFLEDIGAFSNTKGGFFMFKNETQGNKRKGRRVVAQRKFVEEEPGFYSETLDELFEMFMNAKEIEGLRERTLADHEKHFRYFKDFLKKAHPEITRGSEVRANTIREYIHYMMHEKGIWDNHQWLAEKYGEKKGLSPVTINIRLRSIKCFFKFLYDDELLSVNPCERIKLLKTEKDTIEAFSEEQVHLLLQQPDQRSYVGFRDYTLMHLFLDTGIRCSEALGLIVDNFDAENKTIVVPGAIAKNNNGRLLPLSKKTSRLIQTLIKENTLIGTECEHIFKTYYGEKLDSSVVRARIKEYGEQASIQGVRVSPHTFRHTFAKWYILGGGDAFTLQRLLDHSTMNMVRKYIQMDSTDIKVQHHQYSPINTVLKKRK